MRGTTPLEPTQIRARQEKSFASLIRQVLASNEFYRGKLHEAGFRSERPIGLSDLGSLPLTAPPELREDRETHPPFGTNRTFSLSRYTRIHRGWLDTPESWSWWLDCWTESLRAAGVTPADHVFVTRSPGRTIASTAVIEAGHRLGALTALAEGTASGDPCEEPRDFGATVLVATPEEASRLLAAIEDRPESAECPERWIVHSEGLDPDAFAVSSMLQAGWNARCFPAVMGHEVGVWGFGCDHGFLHVNEAEFIVEVIDPGTAEPAPADPEGTRRGELVLTNLGRIGSPVIRYLTGIMVRLFDQTCPCGRITRRIEDGIRIGQPRGRSREKGAALST